MKEYKRKFNQKGQALLIVLLSMAVILTVVLSTVSRSVTDIKIGDLEEDALRAFSAAEAGVEYALSTGLGDPSESLPTGPGAGTSYSVTVAENSEGSYYNFPEGVSSGDTATFWFVSHDASNNLVCGSEECLASTIINQLCWGNPGTLNDQPTTPAIELSVFYDLDQGGITSGNFDSVNAVRAAYDSNALRASSNHFSPASYTSCTIGSKTYPFRVENINLTGGSPFNILAGCLNTEGCLLMARVRMLYNNVPQPLGIEVTPTGGTLLPAQGRLVESVGSSGQSVRRVNVFQGFLDTPSAFDAAVYSGGDLTK